MSSTLADPAHRIGGLSWPFAPVGLPLFYLWLAWSWWFEIRGQLLVVAETMPAMNAETMATLALGARALATLSEAGIYVLWWKGRRRRLPYWRFLSWVATLSTTDLFGFSLRRAVDGAPDAIRTASAVLAGPGVLESPAAVATGGMVGFGSLGILTMVRVTMTAWAQARGIDRPLAGPLILTASAWLLTRLIGWWSVDLLRGVSPAP